MSVTLTEPSLGSAGWGAVLNQALTDLQNAVNARVLTTGGGQSSVATITSTGLATLDLSTASLFVVTLTANTTIALGNSALPANTAASIDVLLKQDATGGRTTTWPASVQWLDGVPPTITATAGSITWVRLLSFDGGTTWYGPGTDVTKNDIGLGNVDNTSDLNKPVSTAQQAAITGAQAYAAGLVDDLSGVTNPSAARTSLGLGSAATHAATDFEPTLASGTLAARPAASTFGKGYYLATDISGGTLYHSDGTTWTQAAGSVNPSGKILAEVVASGAYTLTTTFADVTTMPTMVIPAGSAYTLEFHGQWQSAMGTAAAGSVPAIQYKIVDVATGNTVYLFDDATLTYGSIAKTLILPLHSFTSTKSALGSPVTVKLQAVLAGSAVAGIGAQTIDTAFGFALPVMRARAA